MILLPTTGYRNVLLPQQGEQAILLSGERARARRVEKPTDGASQLSSLDLLRTASSRAAYAMTCDSGTAG